MLSTLALALTVAAGAATGGTIEKIWRGPDRAVALMKERGDCPEGEKAALFSSAASATEGCWFERDETVWIWWKDGDRSAVPPQAFKAPADI